MLQNGPELFSSHGESRINRTRQGLRAKHPFSSLTEFFS